MRIKHTHEVSNKDLYKCIALLIICAILLVASIMLVVLVVKADCAFAIKAIIAFFMIDSALGSLFGVIQYGFVCYQVKKALKYRKRYDIDKREKTNE